MDHDERIFEYALGRHFREQDGTDLSRQVREAWELGEPGSMSGEELEEIRSYVEGPQLVRGERIEHAPEENLPRRTSLRRWLAAAAAVLAALGAWTLLSEEPVGSPGDAPPGLAPAFAVADREVQVLRGPARVATRTTELERGDAILLTDAPIAVSFAGGASLHAQAPALFVLDGPAEEPRVALYLGDLVLNTAGGPAEVWTDFAALRLGPSAGMTVAVSQADRGVPLDLPLARTVLVSGIDAVRTLRTRVTEGTAELTADDLQQVLDPLDGAFSLASRSAPVVSGEDYALYAELSDLLFREVDSGVMVFALPPAFGEAMRELGQLLAREPMLAADFRTRVERVRSTKQPPRIFTSYVLDLMAMDPDALELASRIWIEEPQAFQQTHVLAYAELGGFEFEREIQAILTHYLAEPDAFEEPPTLPALFLAFRGDAAGRALLEKAARPPTELAFQDGWDGVAYLLASAALDDLGEDRHWQAAKLHVSELVDELLLRDATLPAARIVAQLDFVGRALSATRPPLLAGLVWRSFTYGSEEAERFEDASEVRAELDAVLAR